MYNLLNPELSELVEILDRQYSLYFIGYYVEFHGPIGPEILALSGLGSDCSEAFDQSTNGDIQCSTLQFHTAMVKPLFT